MIATAAVAKSEAVGRRLARRLSGFAATLRMNGYAVGLAETRDALRVLASEVALRPVLLKQALRALFCATRSDWLRFDDLFEAYWRGRGARRIQSVRDGGVSPPASSRKRLAAGVARSELAKPSEAVGGAGGGATTEARGEARRDAASASELLAKKDLRHIVDPEEMTKLHALVERLARRMRARLVRREQARRRGRRLDVRRTIHRGVAHGGAPIELVWRRRKHRPLKLVLLLDASGSMEPYTAFFVRFVHAVIDAFRQAEAFVFHTRLVHVSSALRERSATRAVERLTLMAQGLGGGTRIGESLGAFNRWHAARVINSRTAVIICSDGYDTGDPRHLGEQMERLARRCRRIVWINPLLGWKDYAPTARGMQAALPYIDLFAPAHNLDSLAALEPYLARI